MSSSALKRLAWVLKFVTAAMPTIWTSPTSAQLPPGVTPYKVDIPQATLDRIQARVRDYQWPTSVPSADWRYGVEGGYIRRLAAYWVSGYDWRREERAINARQLYRVPVAGERVMFLWERGSGHRRMPLMILPGWPYSFASYLPIVDCLAHPERFGGKAADGVDVVIPSLPGFAFSDRPARPIGPREIGRRMNLLMHAIGYPRYLVHGGDIGAHAASWMAFDAPASVAALSTTFVVVRQAGAEQGSGVAGPHATPAERAYVAAEKAGVTKRLPYALVQMTEPQTLSFGMRDSPVGAAAWIVDKFHDWGDLRSRPFEEVFTMDELLDEVMLYEATDSFDSAIWFYAGFRDQQPKVLPRGRKITTPTWVAAFPDPLVPPPPRELVNRSHNVVHWTTEKQGGHFPFYETPDNLKRELSEFIQHNPK